MRLTRKPILDVMGVDFNDIKTSFEDSVIGSDTLFIRSLILMRRRNVIFIQECLRIQITHPHSGRKLR